MPSGYGLLVFILEGQIASPLCVDNLPILHRRRCPYKIPRPGSSQPRPSSAPGLGSRFRLMTPNVRSNFNYYMLAKSVCIVSPMSRASSFSAPLPTQRNVAKTIGTGERRVMQRGHAGDQNNPCWPPQQSAMQQSGIRSEKRFRASRQSGGA